MIDKNYEYFLTVAKEKNITRASEKLYISQPALSKHLMRLEESLGIRLLDRTKGNLRLTYAGELYARYLEELKAKEKKLLESFAEIKNDDRGLIRFGMTPYRSSIMLPAIFPRFRARYPNIQLILTENTNRDLILMLEKEKIDFCISDPINTINYDLFEYDPLLNEKVYLAISDTCPLVEFYVPDPEQVKRDNRRGIYPPMDVSRICEEPFFMTNVEQSMSYIIETCLAKNGICLKNVFRSSNLYTAINLTAAGMGFSFMPEYSIRQPYFPPSLLLFSMKDLDITWEHALFFKSGSYISSHCRKLISLIKEIYTD